MQTSNLQSAGANPVTPNPPFHSVDKHPQAIAIELKSTAVDPTKFIQEVAENYTLNDLLSQAKEALETAPVRTAIGLKQHFDKVFEQNASASTPKQKSSSKLSSQSSSR